jgi:hypothetical protein
LGRTLVQNSPTWLPTKIFSITSFVPSFATPTATAENTNIATPSENGDTRYWQYKWFKWYWRYGSIIQGYRQKVISIPTESNTGRIIKEWDGI